MSVTTLRLLRQAQPGLTLADLVALTRLLTRPELDVYAAQKAQNRLQ